MRFSAATLLKATNTIGEHELLILIFLFHSHNPWEAKKSSVYIHIDFLLYICIGD